MKLLKEMSNEYSGKEAGIKFLDFVKKAKEMGIEGYLETSTKTGELSTTYLSGKVLSIKQGTISFGANNKNYVNIYTEDIIDLDVTDQQAVIRSKNCILTLVLYRAIAGFNDFFYRED